MNRRSILLGFGTAAAGAGAVFGSGAFTQVQADRDLTIRVDEDSNALLGITAGSNVASVYKDSGELAINTDELSAEGEQQGFAVGSTVSIGGTNESGDVTTPAFTITNNFDELDANTEGVSSGLNIAIDLTNIDLDNSALTQLTFVGTPTSGTTQVTAAGERNVFEQVSATDSIEFAIEFKTASTGSPEPLDSTITFQAGSDLTSDDFPTEDPGDPIRIADWNDLASVGTDEENFPSNGDYVLANDLDQNTAGYEDVIQADGFAPLSAFTGEFDGQGNTIAELKIGTDSGRAGLFARAGGNATIKNVRFSNPTFEGQLTDPAYAGILVGDVAGGQPTFSNINITGANLTVESGSDTYAIGTLAGLVTDARGETTNFTFENIEITGTSIASNATPARQDQGGLIGQFQALSSSNASMSNIFVTGSIDAEGSVSSGGLIGTVDDPEGNTPERTIENIGTAVDITITNYDSQSSPQGIGGVTGMLEQADLTDAYAIGDITVDGGSVGGIIGEAKPGAVVETVFAAGNVSDNANVNGGLVGRFETDSGSLTKSNWDSEATSQSEAVGENISGTLQADSLTTNESQGLNADENFSDGFDFNNTWETVVDGYPILQALGEPTQFDAQE